MRFQRCPRASRVRHVTVCTAIWATCWHQLVCLFWQENACSCYKKNKNNFVKNRLLTYYQYYHTFLYSAWIFLVLQHIFDPAWLDKYWVSDKSVDGTSVRLWKLQPVEAPNTSDTGLWKLQPGSKMAEFPCKWVGLWCFRFSLNKYGHYVSQTSC